LSKPKLIKSCRAEEEEEEEEEITPSVRNVVPRRKLSPRSV
jgi:hypothetical protein